MTKWPVVPLRSLARGGGLFCDGDWIETPFIADDGIRLVQTGNIGIGVYRDQGFRFVSPQTFHQLNCTEVIPGDVLICRLADPVGRSCLAPNLLGVRMITSVDVAILRPRATGVDNRYLNYYCSSSGYLDFVDSIARGGTRQRISRDQLGSIPIFQPPVAVQRAIADYLDREMARIDALIAAKRRMIELLQERWETARGELVIGVGTLSRQTIAGPEWMGNIPRDWTVERLKFLATMESGHTPDRKVAAYWEDCTIPWVTLNDVGKLQDEWFITEPVNAINELGMANSAAHLLPSGTVILSRDATVGRAAILGRPMAVSQHYVGWICRPRLAPEYLLHVLRGPMQKHFATLTAGATIATIGMPELSELVVPVPPFEEQLRTVADLRSLEDRWLRTRIALSRQLALLQERRQALITAAVTGEMGIPGVVA